jgi:hypothetical protein
MIANFVVRLSVVSLRYSQSHIIKNRARQIRNPSISALPFSSLLLQFFPLLSGGFPLFLQVIAVELLHVLSGLQQLLHFPFCFPVAFVDFLFLNNQLCIFLPEFFDRRQLGSSGCIECFLCRLVKRDLCPMLFKELFAVSGLPVPRPAPRATTSVCNTVIALLKNAILESSFLLPAGSPPV